MASDEEMTASEPMGVASPQLPELSAGPSEGTKSEPWLVDKRKILAGVPVEVEVVLGRASMTLDKLTRLTQGETVALNEEVGEPVELRVNGQVFGRGELVVVDDNYGVRVTQLAKLNVD